MVNFCTGSNRKRLRLALTRFYSPEELFDIVAPLKTSKAVSVEYGPNLFVAVENEHELRFACKMVAHDHASYIPEADYHQHVSDAAESTHTDKFETYLADANKARRAARRHNKSKTRSYSVPPTDTTSVPQGGVCDMSTRTSTREMSNDSGSTSS